MLKSSARPNIFVVGDAKCGTTSLYSLFAQTPAIGTTTRKEFHFFSAPEQLQRVAGPGDDRITRAVIRDEVSYLAEFASLPPDLPVIVDVSPSYLQNPVVPERIRAFAPDAKIIITLREPAAKVFSQYVHLWSEGRETLPFEEGFARSAQRRAAGYSTMFDYEAGGYYADAVARYFEVFGRERVHVILFEELIGATADEIAKLEAFLGVTLPTGPLPHSNAGGRLKSPLLDAILRNEFLRSLRRLAVPIALRHTLSQTVRLRVGIDKPLLASETRSMLSEYFSADVANLEGILGTKTGWLLK